ncbi:MAG: hypothetical protein PHO64_12555, partial [Thiomonas sp.]|nr:hypothetical protein [Thiomonas sp.]
ADHWQALRLVRLSGLAAHQAERFLLRGRIEAFSADGRRVRVNGVWMSLGRKASRIGLAVGAQVVARGAQGPQGEVVDSLQRSTPVAAPVGSRVVLVGYLQHAQQGWESHGLRIEGANAALNAELQSASRAQSAPLIIVGALRSAQTVVVERVIPNVDAMQFALPPSAAAALSNPAKAGDAASVGGAAAQSMQSLQSGQGIRVPMPGVVSPTLPAVILPAITAPSMPVVPGPPQMPSVSVPSVVPPVVTTPNVAPPQAPSVSPPTVNTPTVATPSLPSGLQIPSVPRP